MAALTATHWTESVEARFIEGKHKRNRVKLTLSITASGSYPSSGGIPLPTTMGMVRNIDYVNVIQPLLPSTNAAGAVSGYLWVYDKDNHSIHGFTAKYFVPTAATGGANPSAHVTSFPEIGTGWVPSDIYAAAPVMYVEAVGW